MEFGIAGEVFELLPTLVVGVVRAWGADNSLRSPAAERMLEEAAAGAARRLEGMHASDDPRVQPYRQAFHALGMSPSRYPSSNIALLRRIAKGKGIGCVNPIVDVGNAVSITWGLPLGAHAVDEAGPGLMLRLSREGDVFVPLGADAPDPSLVPGELVYAQGNQVHTRRWTWRQSECGKIGPATRDVLFPIDGFADANLDEVIAARDDLARRLREVFGCEVDCDLVRA